MMREVRNIESHMRPVIHELYGDFLRECADPEEREYGTDAAEIEANFVHRCYVSFQDVRICRGFDINSLSEDEHFELMKALHESMIEAYLDVDADSARVR